ncbi:trace amine-associated receptor 1-like [Brachyistius frenatus]|uniref:trace amine-associated receptor 1-like n=1 Tax=Brachyistius frenatus TaxID=100188 RepID=UPI0037E89311
MESFNRTGNLFGFHFCESENDILCALLYVFLGSLTAVTICGNLLVIISIIYFKQLHTPTNYLILSLALSDLLIGALIFPFTMSISITSCLSRYSLSCKIRDSLDTLVSFASLLNLFCVAIDRYYAVCQPLIYKTKVTGNVALMMCLGSWVISLFFVFYQMIINYGVCEGECFGFLLFVCFSFYLPAVILVCIYLKILIVAQRQGRSIQNAMHQSVQIVSKKERKATKTLAMVMGLFLLCWLPLFILYPFQYFSYIIMHLLEPFNWFAIANSMFNPFIYGFFYSWFRSAFRMIISGKIFQGNYVNIKLH